MIQSVRWPFAKTARGGLARTAATDHGEEVTRQTITLGHLPGPSNNPFDEAAGIGAPDVTFMAGTGDVAGLVVHSRGFFRRMESRSRARLEPGFPRVEGSDADATAVVAVEYVNLETGAGGRVEVR